MIIKRSLILLLLAACNSRLAKTIAITEQSANSIVEMSAGDILEVTLTGNPSTGFLWEPLAVDTAVIKQKGEWRFVPDNDTPGFVGSPGKLTMHFEAVGLGQEMLRLIYRRPFEPDIPPAQTFEITVVVK